MGCNGGNSHTHTRRCCSTSARPSSKATSSHACILDICIRKRVTIRVTRARCISDCDLVKAGVVLRWLLALTVFVLAARFRVLCVHRGQERDKRQDEGVRAIEAGDDISERLSAEATILLAATPEQVQLLNEALALPMANVTTQEMALHPVSSIDIEMEERLASKDIKATKELRVTVVFMDDEPLKLDNSKVASEEGPICRERQRAMLVSLGNVTRHDDNKLYGSLLLHDPSAPSLPRPLPGVFNLAALNPFMWGGNHIPTGAEIEGFRGTAVCLKEGSLLQLIKGWPMRIPAYKDGPWEARAAVERALVTSSAGEKKKNSMLLQAVLRIIRVPKEGIFKDQNLDTIPFMGYVKADATKQTRLRGALIRHQLLKKTCKLRREKAKSQVELLCEEVEATLADLNDMVEERPKLREMFRKTGVYAGLSAASFSLALVTHLLGTINKELEIFSVEGCLWGGAAAGVLSLLYAAINGPIVAIKRFDWRQRFKRKKREYLEKVLKEEEKLPSSLAATADLVVVVNELEQLPDEVPDPSELGINADVKPDASLTTAPATTSPLERKVQPFISRYIYLEAILPALERLEKRDISRFKQQAEEDRRELARLKAFLRKAGKLHAALLTIRDSDVIEFNAEQTLQAYRYLGEQLQQELARDLRETEGPFLPLEALYSKFKADCIMKKIRELYAAVKKAGGDPLPIDVNKPLLTSMEKRLRQVKESEELIDSELLGLEMGKEEKWAGADEKDAQTAKKDLLAAKAAVKEAADAMLLELRTTLEDDLQLALEELDNQKEVRSSLQKAVGKQPSLQQEAEMTDTKGKIKELNRRITSTIYRMRTLGLEVDLPREIPLEGVDGV